MVPLRYADSTLLSRASTPLCVILTRRLRVAACRFAAAQRLFGATKGGSVSVVLAIPLECLVRTHVSCLLLLLLEGGCLYRWAPSGYATGSGKRSPPLQNIPTRSIAPVVLGCSLRRTQQLLTQSACREGQEECQSKRRHRRSGDRADCWQVLVSSTCHPGIPLSSLPPFPRDSDLAPKTKATKTKPG